MFMLTISQSHTSTQAVELHLLIFDCGWTLLPQWEFFWPSFFDRNPPSFLYWQPLLGYHPNFSLRHPRQSYLKHRWAARYTVKAPFPVDNPHISMYYFSTFPLLTQKIVRPKVNWNILPPLFWKPDCSFLSSPLICLQFGTIFLLQITYELPFW